jgi:hypothetical protein
MSNDGKKPVWVSLEAHETLRAHCEKVGKTQVEVFSDLVHKQLKPKLDEIKASAS